MSKLETNTIDTVSGTSTLQVGSTNTSTITLGVSGDTINVPSGVTIANSGTATGFAANTPAFHVYESSSQTVSANTYTKVTLNEELYDTNNNFASDRFTPTTAGKYFIYGNIHLDGASYPTHLETAIYKNGSIIARNFTAQSSATVYGNKIISTTVDMNGSSDYVELYGKLNYAAGNNYFVGGQKDKFFGGYKIIT